MSTVTLKWLLEKAEVKLGHAKMNKTVAKITRKTITDLYEKGIYVGVSGGFRSFAEQDALYAKGRTTAGSIVTQAKGGQSNHNFGVAVDLFQYSKDGTEAIFKNDANFQQIVKSMKSQGMKWGGDWRGFKDTPHFEWYDKVGGAKTPTATSTPKPENKPSTSGTHKIVKGDTLSEIAEKYDVTVKNLQDWNGLKGTEIVAGKTLKVKKPAQKEETVKVEIGDTLNGIASKNGLKMDQLLKLNPKIKNPNSIYPDQKIRIK